MFWVAQVMGVSFVIIFILHNLYFFFKETLTVPKMKDMVKRPQQRYDALFRELRVRNEDLKNNSNDGATDAANDAANNAANNANSNANDAMKNELKRYLMEIKEQQSDPEPQPHPMFNSNFIEMGSAYK
jgi:hypothetical protein